MKTSITSFLQFLNSIELFLKRRGAICVAFFAVVYYGFYYNADLTLTGEAGSNVLIAQRVLEGWRPIKDMFIGYNLMWFYPLSAIFKFTGPHLLASRIFFMCLCGITGILGFCLVRRITGNAILAAVAAGLMILMPGAMFRNNVGFVGTLASFALIYGYVIKNRPAIFNILWMGVCGALMSLCFLIRIEPSLIALIVWMGLITLYPIGEKAEVTKLLKTLILGTLLSILAFAIIHAPFVIHAYKQGFGPEFTSQYGQFVQLLNSELNKELNKIIKFDKKKSLETPSRVLSSPQKTEEKLEPMLSVSSASSAPLDSSDGRRAKPSWNESFKGFRISFFPLAIYFPILTSIVLVIFGLSIFLSGILNADSLDRQIGLGVLVTTGCALALFPQYFFFRPDSVHLSEFMVPFYPALATAAGACIGIFLRKRKTLWFGVFVLGVVSFQAIIAFNALFGREGSGSIRIARGKTAEFRAPGGIDFKVDPKELQDWEGLRDLLASSTHDGDFLVTYPYVPLLNVMSEKPSYQFKLYVDNATEAGDFSEKTIRELQVKKPAVVVVNNRDINKSEFSRFRNWAAPVYDFLQKEYILKNTFFKQIEVFVRPDRAVVTAPNSDSPESAKDFGTP